MNRAWGLAACCLVVGAPAFGQAAVDIDRLEREAATISGELERVEAANREVPEVFAPVDREERQTWGAVHHLNKDYLRAALALYGAVEPRDGEDVGALQANPAYAESLYLLGDSLNEMGNVLAARFYFERLLRLGRHAFLDEAILRLMEMASNEGRFDDVDRAYAEYLALAGSTVPGQVRYLHARSLFFAGRDAGALEELGRIPTGDAFDLRARYLRVAVLTRQDRLADALAVVDDALKQRVATDNDEAVRESLQMARARLLYELDRLDESIDAYQEIGLESRHLATMLYEVSLTYVRRGQLAQRPVEGDGLTDSARRERASAEYKKALRQLEDLRALDASGDQAEFDLLAASLMLQVRDFDGAHDRFADVAARFEAADQEIQRLAGDVSVRDQILQDILALERDPRATLTSPLPAVAARRAAKQRDVARSLQAFKELQQARTELEELDRILSALETMISPENPARVEAFASMRSAVERSQSVANATTNLRVRALAAERSAARLSPDQQASIATIVDARVALEQRLKTLPQTTEGLAQRRQGYEDRLDAVERSIHELNLLAGQLRAAATATAWLAQREGGLAPARREQAKIDADAVGRDLRRVDDGLTALGLEADAIRQSLLTMGGRGSGEDLLRQELDALVARERAVLLTARGGGGDAARFDRVHATLDGIAARNVAFRGTLDATVDARLADARALLARERQSLGVYRQGLDVIDVQAGDLRGQATMVALDRVRREVSQIVLKADVGVIDTAFARKQRETETISGLQRARSLELTDLTQAYADLTRDELP